jgi:hypothetical protein
MAATVAHPDQLARLRHALAAPAGRVVVVDVPMGNFLMVDGSAERSSPQFDASLRAVAELAGVIRLFLQPGADELLRPMPVEVLWYAPDNDAWHEALDAEWSWTAMVAQPASATPELVAAVRDRLADRLEPEISRRVRLGSLREGLCAQAAHPSAAEPISRTLDLLRDHARARGYEPVGPYHEIHLAELRRNAPIPLRTIVRQPIRRVG